jgi:hypothetical protein
MDFTKYNQSVQREFSNKIVFPGVKNKATLNKLKGANILIFLLDKEVYD